MPEADPDRVWWPADDLDRVLELVWGGCLNATIAKDRQEDIHDCSVCDGEHMILDEAKYVDAQAASMRHARRVLDAMMSGLSFDDARAAARQGGAP